MARGMIDSDRFKTCQNNHESWRWRLHFTDFSTRGQLSTALVYVPKNWWRVDEHLRQIFKGFSIIIVNMILRSEISESQSFWHSYIIILQVASMRDVITCLRHVWLKNQPQPFHHRRRARRYISVCSDCFICGKKQHDALGFEPSPGQAEPITRALTTCPTATAGLKKKIKKIPDWEGKKKNWTSIGCDNYNFLSKAPKFTSDVLLSCLWQK